eukprot:c55674_g1_i1.p1 GENE.c55674_g1_i1~~c55674_g1_i1.p1  ORF type:complete len:144 (+),score=35.41 c55674_g1_i1:31-432(+)
MSSLLFGALGSLRAAAGGLTLLAPGFSTKLFGLGDGVARDNGSLMAARLFGVRDLVIGGALLSVGDRNTIRTLLQMGLIIDAIDVVSYLVINHDSRKGVKGREPFGPVAHVGVAGGAAAFVLIGLFLLRTDSF